jgi:BirA family biotin operon repressor/biotin-[acetyl-CoA-carboxylase] ligase
MVKYMKIKEQILEALHKKKGRYISGGELGAQLNVSRTAVWKHIQALREERYVIESSAKSGYRLLSTPDLLLPYEVKRGLQTTQLGQEIHYFKETGSTNDIAKELASEDAQEGTIVIAETQKSGRGRLGREWISPKGGVWLSVILRPQINPEHAPKIAIIAGLAVVKTLTGLYNIECKLKWPNDVLIKEKKVCGILTEIDAEMDKINYIVVGIGINANVDLNSFPVEIKKGATTLKNELKREVSRVRLVQRLLEELESNYTLFNEKGFSQLREEWKKFAGTLGRRVRIITQDKIIEGEAVDIDGDGALLVRLDDGSVEKVISGDCVHLNEKI